MKYSRELTHNLSITMNKLECIEIFDDLNLNDGFVETPDLFEYDTIVLNMDCVETRNAFAEHRDNRRSMDCAFGIESNETIDQEILMVELRYNYLNLKNLTRQELIEKVAGTTLALGGSVQIHKESIFIFQKSLKEQARSRLFRMNPRVPSEFIVMDIYELKTLYFD